MQQESSSPSMMTSLEMPRCDSTKSACSSPRRALVRLGRASVLGCTISGSCRFLRCFCSSSALCGEKKRVKGKIKFHFISLPEIQMEYQDIKYTFIIFITLKKRIREQIHPFDLSTSKPCPPAAAHLLCKCINCHVWGIHSESCLAVLVGEVEVTRRPRLIITHQSSNEKFLAEHNRFFCFF